MSKLIVEVCKIDEVLPHDNAERLEIVKIKGWQCIVGKGQYKVGDLAVYCPPDSIIPPDIVEQYKLEFLKKNGKVGTIKLRGIISQGLVLEVPAGVDNTVGTDVAKSMGITKYEPPEPEYNKGQKTTSKKKTNPLFDKYTDIENINHFTSCFEEGERVVITEKIHGCNARFGMLPIPVNSVWGMLRWLCGQRYEFVYGSRTVQKNWTNSHHGFYAEDVWGKIAKRYQMATWMPKDYIVYGEIYGAGIQDLTYGLVNDVELAVFDVKYKNKYLSCEELETFYQEVLKPHGIKFVPILFKGQYNDATRKVLTAGNSEIYNAQIREGCVIKPIVERENHLVGRVILKSVSEAYLLRKGGTEFK